MRLDQVIRFQLWLVLFLAPVCGGAEMPASAPNRCLGTLPIGSFRLLVEPEKAGPPRPIALVNNLKGGEKLRYEPIRIPEIFKDKAQIAVVLVEPSQQLAILNAHPAAKPAAWKVPKDTAVVALVFGPHGLNVKKVKSLVGKDEELLSQLADYAEQTEKIEALVDVVAKSEAGGASMDAALAGFSAQYGVALPKIDTHAPSDQQAGVLLKALMPSVSAYDPLTPRATVQQSTGLAASLAATFFGTPAGLAAGGASLFQNLRLVLFPDTEFRSAIAHALDPERMALCAKPQAAKAHTRVAYLWAHRVPAMAPPAAAIANSPHLPIGVKSAVQGNNLQHLERAHDWRLVAMNGKLAFPVDVACAAPTLTLDLAQTKAPPGEYRLATQWDWDALELGGTVHLDALDNLNSAGLTSDSRDRLVEAGGRVPIELTGANFEFVEKAAIEKDTKRPGAQIPLDFTLPKGKRAGDERSMEVEIDTNALGQGSYKLMLTQADQKTHTVPIIVHPPNPRLENLPVRVNLGEAKQPLRWHGSGLDRIERVTSPAGEITTTAGGMTIELRSGLHAGAQFPIEIKVRDIDNPIRIPNAIAIAGPRPKITAERKSFADGAAVSLRTGEVPAGAPVSFELTVEHLDRTGTVSLTCGDSSAHVAARLAGAGVLFFALDPASVGAPGCSLTATVAVAATGASDPMPLGRVVRLPRIQHFQLTDEKAGDSAYAGLIEGENLEIIAKTGWDDHTGLAVDALPAPIPDQTHAQTLKIVLPWPAPSPHAPLFIWLRGEETGRPTGVKY